MSDLIQNMQSVYKKWESKATPTSGIIKEGYRRTYPKVTSRYQERMREPRNKRPSRYQQFSELRFDDLAQFKMYPTVLPKSNQRPYPGICCQKCVPISRVNVPNDEILMLGRCNILKLPYFNLEQYSFLKCIQSFNFLKGRQKPPYSDITLNVLQNERILHAIQIMKSKKREDEKGDGNMNSVELQCVKKMLQHIQSSVSIFLLRICGWILHNVFKNILDGLVVHKGQIEMLQVASQADIPIVYLPLHRSHLDYILVSFVLLFYNLKVPLVAAGDNLCIPFFGGLLRRLGAFYIRRQLDGDRLNKDHLYRAVLQTYLSECLKSGQNIEFFLEGQRSRSGKPQTPKHGLLSVVVDSVLKGDIEDAYISPVSISYEKVVEGNFISEQLGHSKKKENFFSALCSMWRVCHSHFGHVRLDFGQPFSLKEFLHSSKQVAIFKTKSPGTDTPPSSPGSLSCEEDCIKNSLRAVVKDLAEHIIYDSMCATSLMSTQLVAFLLLSKYRKGVTQQQLQHSFDWLRQELNKKRHDLGFSGESLLAIKRGVSLLGSNLVFCETVEMEWTSSDMENNNLKVIVYKPQVKLPHVLELQYYANALIPSFFLDSVIANAVYALVDVEICHFLQCDSKLYISKEKLVNKAKELCDWLRFEFIAVSPCTELLNALNDVVEEFIAKECLQVLRIQPNFDRGAKYSRSRNMFDSSEEDEVDTLDEQQLKVNLSEDSISHLDFTRNILSPYIESYWLAASSLLKLVHEVKEESIFIRDMQKIAQESLSKGFFGT